MTPCTGHVARLRNDGGKTYMILILSRSFRSDERWRCMVLVDDINPGDVGLIVEYRDISFETYFDRVM